jgi:hypothetical protein
MGTPKESAGKRSGAPKLLEYLEMEEKTLQPEQTVSEMANEVLTRQAKARAEQRGGEPIEEAMEAVLNTEAGRELRDLRDGPHGEEGFQETQAEAARERARERAEDLGKRFGKIPGPPCTVDGANFLENAVPAKFGEYLLHEVG